MAQNKLIWSLERQAKGFWQCAAFMYIAARYHQPEDLRLHICQLEDLERNNTLKYTDGIMELKSLATRGVILPCNYFSYMLFILSIAPPCDLLNPIRYGLQD